MPHDFVHKFADLEGQLQAHRRLLARLLAALDPAARDEIEAWMALRETLTEGQEDPSLSPADGLALEKALARELHEIGAVAEARLQRLEPSEGLCWDPQEPKEPQEAQPSEGSGSADPDPAAKSRQA